MKPSRKIVTGECQLDNDKSIRKYDLCNSNLDTDINDKSYKNMIYLGIGVIYSIDNAEQKSTQKYHFWRKNNVKYA